MMRRASAPAPLSPPNVGGDGGATQENLGRGPTGRVQAPQRSNQGGQEAGRVIVFFVQSEPGHREILDFRF